MKHYDAPTITELGTVADLTMGFVGVTGDDFLKTMGAGALDDAPTLPVVGETNFSA